MVRMITSERPRGLFPRFSDDVIDFLMTRGAHDCVSTFFFADLRLCQQKKVLTKKKSADSAFFTTTRKGTIVSGDLTVEKKSVLLLSPYYYYRY